VVAHARERARETHLASGLTGVDLVRDLFEAQAPDQFEHDDRSLLRRQRDKGVADRATDLLRVGVDRSCRKGLTAPTPSRCISQAATRDGV